MTRILLLLLAAAAPGACVAEGAAPRPAAKPAQQSCFCIQYTAQAVMPYYLGRLALPGCEKLKYKDNGHGPFGTGLLSCEDLQKCLQPSANSSGRIKLLQEKAAAARKKRGECCPPGAACDRACVKDWDAILKILSDEMEKLLASERSAIDDCIARRQQEMKSHDSPVTIKNGLRYGSVSAD